MTEPRRYLDDPGAPSLARNLLASAAADAPDPAARSATAKRLGIAVGLVAGSKTATATSALAWWKIGVVVLGTVATIAIVRQMKSSSTEEAPVAAPVVVIAAPSPHGLPSTPPAPEPVAVAPAPAPEPAPVAAPAPAMKKPRVVKAAPVVEPTPEPPPVEAVAEVAPASVATPVEAPPDRSADRLAAEVAALDHARGQLRAKSYAAALASVRGYLTSFPDGALRAEASVVEIEAFVDSGRPADARAAADAFFKTFPQSPLVRRVRSLVARTKETR